MAHKHTSSTSSAASSLTTLSPSSSLSSIVSVRGEVFKEGVEDLRSGDAPLSALVGAATTLIDIIAANEEKNTLEFGGSTLKLDAVLRAMLDHAEGCGGKDGKRYTASAISLCAVQDDPNHEKTLVMLHDLGKTWVSHLLFIFRADASHSAQRNKAPSEIATPSLESTASLMDYGVTSGNRDGDFKDQLLERDGYRCIATGKVDVRHPLDEHHPFDEDLTTWLIGCHIIRRAISIYDSRKDPEVFNSAMATFDILRNYAGLSEKTLQSLEDNIDDPANGLLLSPESHLGFDNFRWCLQETDVLNKYKIKVYGRGHGIGKEGDSKIVEFRDRSTEFQTGQAKPNRKRAREIPLPEPCYLRIHAVIAGILHMSGAGKFFDELLEKYDDEEGSSPVRSWEEFNRVIETVRLREQLSTTLSVTAKS
ncbi:hypothetical protein BD779DRAFT_1532590 [Infundibulicybe gibba]|nr:hypothetical protein BD779DRAFT_1532590 [Infundibulicybe gibba]